MRNDSDIASRCPFCNSHDHFEHVLLCVDKTFRLAEGGILMDAFSVRWMEKVEFRSNETPSVEVEAFESLLAIVRSLLDAAKHFHVEDGFGTRSEYEICYASTIDRAQAAIEAFEANSSTGMIRS